MSALRSKEIGVKTRAYLSQRVRSLVGDLLFGKLLGTRFIVEGWENIPKDSPRVFTFAPHLSSVDFLIPQVIAPSLLPEIGKEEVFLPVIGRVLEALGGIPVRRGKVDRQAIDKAVAVITSRRDIALSIEGTRGKGTARVGLKEPRNGVIYIAQRAAQEMGDPVFIVPMAVTGTEGVFPLLDIKGVSLRERFGLERREITVRIGDPIIVELVGGEEKRELFHRDRLRERSDQIMIAIGQMLPPRYHGVFTGRIPQTTSWEVV